MGNIRLSICIATFNRGKFIRETLDSIISQATNDIEIVVVDGSSTDETPEVIRECQQRFSRLRYFRQKSNNGVDKDFALAVDLATGEYCWLFSDDDVMKPGAIRSACQTLDGQYALVIANSEIRTADLAEVLQPRRLGLTADRVYAPGEANLLFAETAAYLTFIGCVIIKKSVWNARNKEKYFGSLFIHVGVIFQSPLSLPALVIADPLIVIRYGNSTWLEKYFEIWMFKWPELVWSFEHYPDESKRAVCAREPWRRLLVLLQNRARGAYSPKMFQTWLEPRLRSLWGRTTANLIAHIPGPLANTFAVVYYLFNRRNPCRRVALVDMKNSRFYLGRSRWGNPTGDRLNHSRTTSEMSTP